MALLIKLYINPFPVELLKIFTLSEVEETWYVYGSMYLALFQCFVLGSKIRNWF